MNFAKRYLADVDPKHAKRKEKYIKNRRRWARKDLVSFVAVYQADMVQKQKRRAKAAQDPSFGDDIPPSALHIDYMSSEYSSAGEDDPEEAPDGSDGETLAEQRRSQWLDVLRAQTPDMRSGKGGWADGVSEKVLEVRTPTWRSARLASIYSRLDTISAGQAALRATPASQQTSKPSLKLGHVAPSHRRFTMPLALMRRGRQPRDSGSSWMWASGHAGVWPPSTAPVAVSAHEVAQAVEAVEAVNAKQRIQAHLAGTVTDAGNGASSVASLASAIEDDIDPSVDALVEGWTEVEG
jgi:hypothetical protein